MKNDSFIKYQLTRISYILKDELEKIKDFNALTDYDKENIKKEAERLSKIYNKSEFGNEYYYRLLYYMYKLKSKQTRELSVQKKLAIIIETIDPEFEMYKIYENNSNIKVIKANILAKFGFFDENLIKVEKLYIEKFYDISEYEFTKKLEP